MKRKIVYIALLSCFIYVSCNQEPNQIENSKNLKETKNQDLLERKSFTDFKQLGYKGQLPYLSTENNDKSITFLSDNDFKEKLSDSKYGWREFDRMFNDNLDVSSKQQLVYTILSQKDLLGVLINNPKDERIKNKVQKYTDVLVESEYIGYCLLYTSLSVLGENSDNISKIIEYSKEDKFHNDILNNPEISENFALKVYVEKIEDNFSYLDKIKELEKK